MTRTPSLLSLVALLLLTGACLGPRGTQMTAAEYQEMEAAERLTAMEVQPAPREGPDAEELAERRADLARKALELDHEAGQLESEAARRVLENELEQAERRHAATRAQADLSAAQLALDFFRGVGQQRRLDDLALDEARAQDRLLETREELAQLELMYEHDLGESTAEIVLARTRRRLERAEEQARLTALAGRRVREVELPTRLMELTAELQAAQDGLRAAEARLELFAVEREAATADLAHRRELLALRVQQHERRAQRLEEDQRALERDQGDSP